jgi:hypothetical protein
LKNDWEQILRNKEAHRRRLAELPFGEKIKILERLRDRDLAMRNAKPISDTGKKARRDCGGQ